MSRARARCPAAEHLLRPRRGTRWATLALPAVKVGGGAAARLAGLGQAPSWPSLWKAPLVIWLFSVVSCSWIGSLTLICHVEPVAPGRGTLSGACAAERLPRPARSDTVDR